jgi:hypothetical protein
VYGGKGDGDINVHNEHTATKLKMVSLYNFMLESFKHKGHCVVMDSAYMGDAMCQVGQEEWKINSFPVMAVNKQPLLGVLFKRGIYPSKIDPKEFY